MVSTSRHSHDGGQLHGLVLRIIGRDIICRLRVLLPLCQVLIQAGGPGVFGHTSPAVHIPHGGLVLTVSCVNNGLIISRLTLIETGLTIGVVTPSIDRAILFQGHIMGVTSSDSYHLLQHEPSGNFFLLQFARSRRCRPPSGPG